MPPNIHKSEKRQRQEQGLFKTLISKITPPPLRLLRDGDHAHTELPLKFNSSHFFSTQGNITYRHRLTKAKAKAKDSNLNLAASQYHNVNNKVKSKHSSSSNSSQKFHRRKDYSICLLIFVPIILLIYFSIIFISFYNISKINDPCFVAKNSLQNLLQLSQVERRLVLHQHFDFDSITSGNMHMDVDIDTTITTTTRANTRMSTNNNRNLRERSGSEIQVQQQEKERHQQPQEEYPIQSSTATIHEFKPEIPKIIHQQWKTDIIPKRFRKWRNKWLKLYPEPEYTHMLWTDASGRKLIKEHYPWFLDTYDNYAYNINRADAVRYFILYHYGGMYADLDYEPIVNFYDYLPQDRVGFIESPYYWNEKTQNSLMSSPKNDPFWNDLFTVLLKNSQQQPPEDVLEMTGPSLVDDARQVSNHPTYVFPCENFHRVPLGEYNDSSFMTVVLREMKFRLTPMSKQCGAFHDDRCHFGKHHNTVSYRNFFGKLL